MTVHVKLAYFNDTSISSTRLNRLRWIETRTVNISGGGVLVELPANLTEEYYMILNLTLSEVDFPHLILGQVRHCNSSPNNRYNVGVEFVINETYKNSLPRTLIRNLPTDLFSLRLIDRQNVDAFINKQNIE